MGDPMKFKKKLTSKLIFGGGLVFAILSALRYYVTWPDMDKLIAYTVIGLLVSAIGWLHGRVDQLNQTNEAQWQYLDKIMMRCINDK